MRALSIRQPWAWLIVAGHKPIENRDWVTHFRGPVLIHASKTIAKRDFAEACAAVADQFGIDVPPLADLQLGGIVGMAHLVDCVSEHSSPWFIPGGHGFVLTKPLPLPFFPCKGSLGFFHVPGHSVGILNQEVAPC